MNYSVRASRSKSRSVPEYTLATVHFAPRMVQLDVRSLKLLTATPKWSATCSRQGRDWKCNAFVPWPSFAPYSSRSWRLVALWGEWGTSNTLLNNLAFLGWAAPGSGRTCMVAGRKCHLLMTWTAVSYTVIRLFIWERLLIHITLLAFSCCH